MRHPPAGRATFSPLDGLQACVVCAARCPQRSAVARRSLVRVTGSPATCLRSAENQEGIGPTSSTRAVKATDFDGGRPWRRDAVLQRKGRGERQEGRCGGNDAQSVGGKAPEGREPHGCCGANPSQGRARSKPSKSRERHGRRRSRDWQPGVCGRADLKRRRGRKPMTGDGIQSRGSGCYQPGDVPLKKQRTSRELTHPVRMSRGS